MKISAKNKKWTKWLIAAGLACVFRGAAARAETIDGFVTKVDTPATFDLGTLHVVMDAQTQCETEILRTNVQLKNPAYHILFAHHYIALQSRPIVTSIQQAPCDGMPLKIGSRVNIIGDTKHPNGSFFAIQVVAYTVNMHRKILRAGKRYNWEGGALLEENPQISPSGRGWTGTLWLDGYPMQITPSTKLLTAPSGTQMGYQPFGLFSAPRMGAIIHAEPPFPAFFVSMLQANTWATYRGVNDGNGTILLYRMRLWPNQIDTRYREYLAKFTPAIESPNYRNHTFGTIKFPHTHTGNVLKILPSQDVQDFVSKIGKSLIPQYQKVLPDSDPTKIHFRFYVVHPVGTTLNNEMGKIDNLSFLQRPSWDEAVVSLPCGLILIPESTLARIDNEAQLAVMLSDAIATVLQKQSYITMRADLCSFWDTDCDEDVQVTVDFVISRSAQAMRLGPRQMYLAGYDIREAPYAWALAQGKTVQNPIINSKHPDQEIPWYAAYAFNYISQCYPDVDYSKLKSGEQEYKAFQQELYKADPSLLQPKSQSRVH